MTKYLSTLKDSVTKFRSAAPAQVVAIYQEAIDRVIIIVKRTSGYDNKSVCIIPCNFAYLFLHYTCDS